MKTKLNLGQMSRAVAEDERMNEEYLKRIAESEIKYSRGNNKVRGKKVGVRKLILAQQYVAASVYRDFTQKLTP